MSVHIVQVASMLPAHCDAQCWAPHETTVPQQAAQADEMWSIPWRQVDTQVASPVQFEERYWLMQLLVTQPEASLPTVVMFTAMSAASWHAPVPPELATLPGWLWWLPLVACCLPLVGAEPLGVVVPVPALVLDDEEAVVA